MEGLRMHRIDKVRKEMEQVGISQLVVSDSAALWYLTGEEIHSGERLTVLVIQPETVFWIRNQLFPLYHKTEDISDISFADGEDGISLLAKSLLAGVCGVDRAWAAEFLLALQEKRKDISFVNGSPCIDVVRACKDAEEIEVMREASRINDRAMARMQAWIQVGMTERECADQLLSVYKEEGAEGFSFPPIVSFGAHGADPHHMPDDTMLQERDVVLLDIGCKKNHYCSDMTRTYFVGEPTEEERKVYQIVEEAGRLAESMVRPGGALKDLDQAARNHIAKAGYGKYFTHRLGHFIGIREHEAGEVSSTSHLIAKPGMIFSIEPGIYLPGKFGVRIEDLVLVTEDGCEVLNKADRQLGVRN